jgi:hypothetical protein
MKLIHSPITAFVLLLVLTGCAASANNPGSNPADNKFAEAGWSQARLDDAFLVI